MRLSLLVKLVLTLAATGILPLSISFYQLRVNKNALLDQLQTTHSVVARTTAERVLAFVEPHQATAETLASVLRQEGAGSVTFQELIRATLQARDIGIVIFNGEGGEVLRAQRATGVWNDLDLGYESEAGKLDFLKGLERRWLRVVEKLPEEAGQVVLVAPAQEMEDVILAREIKDADVILANLEGEALFGTREDFEGFPSEALELAFSGKFRSESKKYQGPETERDVVVAFAAVDATPWVVLSRQDAVDAETAQRRIRNASGFAALGALLLTAALSQVAYVTVIRPLRRLIRAQQDLVGDAAVTAGSEIDQLEAAFEILEQRVRDQEELGRIALGRYQVVDVLGSGAMGTVFKGWDPKLERPLALKTIKLETDDIQREKLVTTLLREAKVSAGFSHPNVVTVFDAADQGKAAFIAMELIDGITLEEMIENHGALGWRRVVLLGQSIASGLAAAHEHQLVHQDVKPANILLGRNGSIKVTDFGISQAITSASASDGVICGTPGFIAPECLEGAGFSSKCDLFALGVLLYECLTGEHPFAGKTLRITILNTLNQNPAPLDDVEPDIPQELADLVFRLLEKNPDRRPSDARSVAQELAAIASRYDLSWSFAERPQGPPPDVRTSSLRTQLFSIRSTQALDLPTRSVEPD